MTIQPITVTIDDHSPEVLAALENAIQRGAMAIGQTGVKHAVDNIVAQDAVDTGQLKNSITYMVQKN